MKMFLQNVPYGNKQNNFFCHLKATGQKSRFQSQSQWYGTDPDPYQNVMEPQNCLKFSFFNDNVVL